MKSAGAVTFDQIQTTPNDGRFVVNEVNADNTMQWNTLANSTTSSSTGTITFHGAPEPATGTVVIGALAIREVFPTGPQCYANCDESTQNPILNVADFTCFLQRFAAGDSYANCDNSTQEPILNVADFTCFLQSFAAGCP